MFEAEAGFSHVELFAGPLEGVAQPFFQVAVAASQVQREVVFLSGEPQVGEWLSGIAVIARGVNAMRDVVADHPVLDSLFKVAVDVSQYDLPHGLEHSATVSGQLRKVVCDGCNAAWHGTALRSALATVSGWAPPATD